jgi:hypothetical protein
MRYNHQIYISKSGKSKKANRNKYRTVEKTDINKKNKKKYREKIVKQTNQKGKCLGY